MKDGWFVGAFLPTAYWTDGAEVAYRSHKAGEPWPRHYQQVATEITLVCAGRLRLNGNIFSVGEIIIVEPGEAVTPKFLTDCTVVVVKVPSLPHDKVIV